MPEATIQKDGDPWASKHQVRGSSKTALGPGVHDVAKPARVQEATNGELGRGIARPIALHRPPGLFVGSP